MFGGRYGLTVHQYEGAWPSADEQSKLGVNYLRVLIQEIDEFCATRLTDLAPGVQIIALLNAQTNRNHTTPGVNSTGGTTPNDIAGWQATVPYFVAQAQAAAPGRVSAVECLNEWDGWGYSVDQAIQCVIDAAPAVKGAGMKCLLGSAITGDGPVAAAVKAIKARGQAALMDGVCFHPYARDADGFPGWGGLPLDEYLEVVWESAQHLPVWVTEWGLPLDESDGGADQATYLQKSFAALDALVARHPGQDILPAACYFSWSDASGHDENGQYFGLRNLAGLPRLGYGSYLTLAHGGPIAGPSAVLSRRAAASTPAASSPRLPAAAASASSKDEDIVALLARYEGQKLAHMLSHAQSMTTPGPEQPI